MVKSMYLNILAGKRLFNLGWDFTFVLLKQPKERPQIAVSLKSLPQELQPVGVTIFSSLTSFSTESILHCKLTFLFSEMFDNLDSFVLEPAPRGVVVKCRITRDRKGMDRGK